jgi:hypothetical protein
MNEGRFFTCCFYLTLPWEQLYRQFNYMHSVSKVLNEYHRVCWNPSAMSECLPTWRSEVSPSFMRLIRRVHKLNASYEVNMKVPAHVWTIKYSSISLLKMLLLWFALRYVGQTVTCKTYYILFSFWCVS